MRDQAFDARARRLAAYVGLSPNFNIDAEPAFTALAARLIRPDPDDSPVPLAGFRARVERTHFAAVFTAHPTFANPPAVFSALAAAASGAPPESLCDPSSDPPHAGPGIRRPAVAAITNGPRRAGRAQPRAPDPGARHLAR